MCGSKWIESLGTSIQSFPKSCTLGWRFGSMENVARLFNDEETSRDSVGFITTTLATMRGGV